MEAISLPIYNAEGREIDTVELDTHIFDGKINKAVIYQAVNAFRANQRMGLAQAKTRGEVSGGGRKPWRQKGTGRARIGSTRSPLWRHGGVTFGPVPRDFSYKLPAKIRSSALRSALCAKIKENNFMVVDSFKIDEPKTKIAVKILQGLKIDTKKSTLLLLDKVDQNAKLALKNIAFLYVSRVADTNVYEVLTHKKLVITREGLQSLIKRLKKAA
ncbi:MAG: 50S ribosomal protein L4 [Candidatus Omnitrophica bacterium]|nr:50S ribosomal protein L4 [Candidatus Omnitrophota bacterium]